METRSKDEIAKSFNKRVGELLERLKKDSTNKFEIANLDRVKSRINTLKGIMGVRAPMRRSAPTFVQYQTAILDRDEKFFMTVDAREECIKAGVVIDKQDEFAFELIESMRAQYAASSIGRRDELYAMVNGLLSDILAYEYIRARK